MPDTSELIGRVFDNRYKIVELIGRGGMGAVYKAIHVSMNQVVALKVLGKGMSNDDRQVQRFYHEAKASSRLKHPNTIKVFDFGRAEDGHLYLAMEFLEGVTLTNLLRQEKVLPVRRALHIAKQVARSLGEAHLNQLVHRDLKPDNIFICRVYGEEDFVKVLDFGIAKFQEGDPEHENLTQAGLVCGTPLYMSPEQGLGRSLDGRSDLYSLGVILYEMLSGRPPFRADTPIALVMRHIHDRPPPMTDHNPGLQLPDALRDLVFGLLEKDREKRIPTAEDLFKAMDAILNAGGFPEEPSKDLVDVSVMRGAVGKTRVESVESVAVDHEESTRFIGQAEEAPVDSDAPTSFMSRDSGSFVRGTGPQRVHVPTDPHPVSEDKTQALPLEGFSSTGNVRVPTRDVPSAGGNRGWIWVAVSLVVLGLATAAGGYVLGWFVIGDGAGGGSEASASNTVPSAARSGNPAPVVEPPSTAPKTLKARLVTVPTGAAVEQGGKGIGTTPMEVSFKEGDPPLSFLFKAPGYRDRTVTITPDEAITKGETTLKYELEKAEDVASPSPAKVIDAAAGKGPEPVRTGTETPPKKDDKPKVIKKPKPKLNWGE